MATQPADPARFSPEFDYQSYRTSASELARTDDLLRIIPKGIDSILEIGARDGHFSRLLAPSFRKVTALDLERPALDIPGVVPVRGDVTRLDYPDDSFDCVLCAEVLEHVPQVERAARELARVARYAVVVGVPYRQDTRVGRTTCPTCGWVNPPWGHVNEFDETGLLRLFSGLEPVETSFVWQNRARTNRLSTWLLDRADNPWGVYEQEEPCLHCGGKLTPPSSRTLVQRLTGAIGLQLFKIQSTWVRPWPNWIHILFRKPSPQTSALRDLTSH